MCGHQAPSLEGRTITSGVEAWPTPSLNKLRWLSAYDWASHASHPLRRALPNGTSPDAVLSMAIHTSSGVSGKPGRNTRPCGMNNHAEMCDDTWRCCTVHRSRNSRKARSQAPWRWAMGRADEIWDAIDLGDEISAQPYNKGKNPDERHPHHQPPRQVTVTTRCRQCCVRASGWTGSAPIDCCWTRRAL